MIFGDILEAVIITDKNTQNLKAMDLKGNISRWGGDRRSTSTSSSTRRGSIIRWCFGGRATTTSVPTIWAMIFFSAHGVPVSYVEEAGDPYRDQMEECILIMQELKARGVIV